MSNWHFIPWTIQYLASGSFIIIISVLILLKNHRSLAYRNFFVYGFSTSAWLFMAFFHRNAPTVELSQFFFKIDILFVHISIAFLPLVILNILRERKIYYWLVLPALIIGVYPFLRESFQIFWSNFGWSYRFESSFGKGFYSFSMLYLLLLCIAFILLIRKIHSKTVRKYKFVFFSYLFFSASGICITNLFLQRNPQFPPLGGILIFIQFILIAYAVSLKPEKIIPYSTLRKPIDKLSKSYISFLNRFQAAIPGKELGEDMIRFWDYVEAMGLKSFVVSESGTLMFKVDKFNEEDVLEIPDSIIRVLINLTWASEMISELLQLILKTYDTLLTQSDLRAKTWLDRIIHQYGGFLIKYDIARSLAKDIELPSILTEQKPGQIYFLKEDTPKEAYGMLKAIEPYNMECLCITKLSPQTIRERYGIQKASFLWMTFEKVKGDLNPKDMARSHPLRPNPLNPGIEETIDPREMAGLLKKVSEFFSRPNSIFILIDCFDQIKFANGFDRALDIVKDMKKLSRQKKAIFIISIPPLMFEDMELIKIEEVILSGVEH